MSYRGLAPATLDVKILKLRSNQTVYPGAWIWAARWIRTTVKIYEGFNHHLWRPNLTSLALFSLSPHCLKLRILLQRLSLLYLSQTRSCKALASFMLKFKNWSNGTYFIEGCSRESLCQLNDNTIRNKFHTFLIWFVPELVWFYFNDLYLRFRLNGYSLVSYEDFECILQAWKRSLYN